MTAGEHPGRDVRPPVEQPRLGERGIGLTGSPSPRARASATTSDGTSCMRVVIRSKPASGSRPSISS